MLLLCCFLLGFASSIAWTMLSYDPPAVPGVPGCELTESSSSTTQVNSSSTTQDVTNPTYSTTWMPDERYALDRNDSTSAAAWDILESRKTRLSLPKSCPESYFLKATWIDLILQDLFSSTIHFRKAYSLQHRRACLARSTRSLHFINYTACMFVSAGRGVDRKCANVL